VDVVRSDGKSVVQSASSGGKTQPPGTCYPQVQTRFSAETNERKPCRLCDKRTSRHDEDEDEDEDDRRNLLIQRLYRGEYEEMFLTCLFLSRGLVPTAGCTMASWRRAWEVKMILMVIFL
jgi:hypothetical protein